MEWAGINDTFRELRETADDFIEVASVDEAIQAVRRLKGDPDLYRRMVANGRKRAESVTFDRLTDRWVEILFERIPAAVSKFILHWTARLPMRPRLAVGRALRNARGARRR